MASAFGRTTPLPFFRWDLKNLQMPAQVMKKQMDTAGAKIGLPPDRLADLELRTLHDDTYLFTHKHLDTRGKWTKNLHLIVKRIVASILSEVVAMFSAAEWKKGGPQDWDWRGSGADLEKIQSGLGWV